MLTDWMSPGVLLSQAWPNSRDKEGETLRALEKVLELGFYERFQTVEIPYVNERKAVARTLRQVGMPLTYTLARVLNENGLNLSSMDREIRIRSVQKVKECLEDAWEADASNLALISGPAPAQSRQRVEALLHLTESLMEVSMAAATGAKLNIIVEPLDYESHKKNTLGTTREAVQLCKNLSEHGVKISLCIDTAHVILNREDPLQALEEARPYIAEFHLCNCVVERSNPLFGDRHIPFGPPGVLGVDEIADMMRKISESDYFHSENKLPVFCEVLNQNAEASMEMFLYCRDVLLEHQNENRRK